MAYKSTSQDRRYAHLLGITYVILAVILAIMLFKIWPPVPWPSDKDMADNPVVAKAVMKALDDCDCGSPTPTPSPATVQTSSSAVPSKPISATAQTANPGAAPALTSQPENSPAAGSLTPTPTPTPTPVVSLAPVTNIPIKFLRWCISTTFDERLIMLVIIAGILGSFVHGATSLADFIGNNNFNKSWTWFYLLRPAIGMALALVFYFVIRGGFLTTSGGAKDINPYGIAALAGLVGMFSKQATDKLGEVFSTLFRAAPGEGDKKRKGALKPDPITITNVTPQPMPAGSKKQIITVNGTNFIDGAVVHLGDAPQPTTFVSPNQLTAAVDDALLAAPATLKLKVVNEEGNESPLIDFVVN
ncbi:MAG TPA: IPT/TIG domain-containing protein [Pyrinomonadaceae bacterium]|jgi:hypothetical protein|nr:IPT/TIG domain-containing protein [Pyrinomonadaceae bacterium]